MKKLYLLIFCLFLNLWAVSLHAQLPPCSGTPNPGVMDPSGPTQGCPGAETFFNVSGYTAGVSGITFQWQSSPDNHTYTNIAGANSSVYPAILNSTVYLRCIVGCSSSGDSAIAKGYENIVSTFAKFNLTGGGGWCEGNPNGVPIYLSGSEKGVDYYEINSANGWYSTVPVVGTGGPITLPAFEDGYLSVVATNDNPACTVEMNGEALITVDVTPVANIKADGPLTICSGGSVVLEVETLAGYHYQWQLNGGAIPGAISSSYAATVSGNFSCVVSDACGSATSGAITVTFLNVPYPSASISAGSSTTFCPGSSVTLSATPTGAGYTYQWRNFGINISGATGTSFVANAFGSYDAVASNGCTGVTNAIAVTPIGSPNRLVLQPNAADGVDALVTNNEDYTNVNFGTNAELDASAWTDDGYYYMTRGFIRFDLSAVPASSYVEQATLTLYNDVTFSNTGHSSLSGSNAGWIQKVTGLWNENTITWNNQPAATAVNEVAVPQSTGPNEDYTLDVTALVQDMVAHPSSNFGMMLRLQTEAAYRSLIFASSDNADSTRWPKLVVNYGAFSALITAAGPTTTCQGDSVILNTTSGEPGVTYKWQKNGAVIPGATLPSYSATTSGNYNCILTNSCSNSTSNTITVTVNISFTASISASGVTTFCPGDSVALNALPTGTGYTYQWRKNGVNIDGATGTSYAAYEQGSYDVVVFNGCTEVSNAIAVTLTGGVAGAGTLILQPNAANGVDAMVLVNSGWYVSQYNFGSWPDLNAIDWTDVAGYDFIMRGFIRFDLSSLLTTDVIRHATLTLYNDPVAEVGEYLTNNNGQNSSQSGSDAGWIQKVTQPWAENAITWDNQPPTTVTNEAILPQSTDPHENYDIDVTALVQNMVTNPASNFGMMLRLQTESAYRALIFASSDNADSTKWPKLVVNYFTPPSVTITAAGATTFCQGGNVTLNATPSGTGSTCQWQLNGATISGASAASYVATTSGNYVCVVTNSCGSGTSNIIAVTVGVPFSSTITASGSTSLCTGGSVTLNATPAGTGYTYQWRNNGVNMSGDTVNSYIANAAGSYDVVIYNGCTSVSNVITVTVNPNPVPTATPTDTAIFSGTPATITLSSSTGGTTWAYSAVVTGGTVSGAVSGTGSPIFQTLTNTGTTPAVVTYTIIATSSSCGSTINASVIVEPANGQISELWGMTSGGGTSNAGVIFETDLSGNNKSVQYNFNYVDGFEPVFTDLTQAPDGKLYGMTSGGGINQDGNIFQYDPSTSTYTEKFSFDDENSGLFPTGSLTLASDGMLYGMTQNGGDYEYGVLFRFDPATSTFTTMHKFQFLPDDGANPDGSLIQASDGKLYGMTYGGGSNNSGILFQFDPVSLTYTNLLNFGDVSDGTGPEGSLLQATDGKLYGMTYQGGINNLGILFQFDPATSTYAKMLDFDGASNGANPYGSLMQASDAKLYGMTFAGGANNIGVLFQFDPAASTYTKKLDFAGASNGGHAFGDLMQASDGKLYGVTAGGGIRNTGVLFQYDPSTSTFTKTFDFNSYDSGAGPWGSLMQASDGKLYGMTNIGGITNYGTLFQYDPSTSAFAKKIDFSTSPTGATPWGSLLLASDGKLYGMTSNGGNNQLGVLFQYDPGTSAYTKELDFTGADNGAPNGYNPYGSSLIQASDGKLYGMTPQGGANNDGVLFQFDPSTSSYTKKLDFAGSSNGANPLGSLMQANDGKLYGMTDSGGANNSGVLFQYDPSTSIYTKKLDFAGTSNGANPNGSLMQAYDGTLYGMALAGGTNNLGVLFQYDPASSTYTKKLDFAGSSNGANPYGDLMQTSDGKLYGMTSHGGTNNEGTLFQYDPSTSTLTKQLDFAGVSNGDGPYGSLILSSNGKLYAMTQFGGTNNYGVLFEYDPATSTYTKKSDFDVTDGYYPYSNLTDPAKSQCTPPVITASSATAFCKGGSVTLTASLGVGYSWSNGANTRSITVTTAGTYGVIVNGCSSTLPITVTFTDPVPVATPSAVSICSGSKTGIALTSNLTGTTWSYAPVVTGGTVTGDASGTSTTISQTLTNTGTTPALVTYRIVASKNGCSDTIYAGATVNPKPTAIATASSATICSASHADITLSGALTGTTFNWTSSITTGSISTTPSSCSTTVCGTSINDSLYNSGVANGTVTYSITPWANGCAGTVIGDVVTVRPVPVATTNVYNTAICSGTYTNIVLSSATAGTTFSWPTPSVTGGFGVSILNGVSGAKTVISQKLVNTGSSQGLVTYSITPAYLGCYGVPITPAVTVNPVATGIASPSPVAICSGASPGITIAPGAVSGITFTWSITSTGPVTGSSACSSSCGTSINDPITNTGIANGVVTYNITPSANGCAGTVLKDVVTIRPIPTASTVDVSTTICNKARTSILLTGTTAGTIYTHTASGDAGTSGFSTGTGALISQTLYNSGTAPASVTYTITPTYQGCPGSAIEASVTVNPVATGIATPPANTICTGASSGLTLNTGPVSGTSFEYTFVSSALQTNTVTGANSCVSACGTIADILSNGGVVNGTVTYSITPWANGCAGTIFKDIVTVRPVPAVYTTAVSPYKSCSGAKTNLPLKSYTSSVAFSYTASLTSGSISGFASGASTSITEMLTNSGSSQGVVTYHVSPSVAGCPGTPSDITIIVNPVANGTASPAPQGICSNTAAGVTLNCSLPGTHFTWTHSVVSSISGATTCTDTTGLCTDIINDRLSSTASAPIEVYTITPWANGCAGTKFIEDVTVQSGTPVTPGIIGTETAICPSVDYTYTAIVAPFCTVNWTLPAGCTLVSGTLSGNPITVSYASGYSSWTLHVAAANLCNNTSAAGTLIASNKGSLCRTSDSAPDIADNMNLIAYPNPAHDKLNVEFTSSATASYLIRMIDITGRIVIERVNTAQEGNNLLEFDMSDLAKGLYILSFTSGEESKQVRVVVE